MGLFIGDTPADVHGSPPGWMWLKFVADGMEIYELDSTKNWEKKTTISFADHNHLTHGDINFTGNILVGGVAGLNGSRVIYGKKLTFTNGLLTGFEDA